MQARDRGRRIGGWLAVLVLAVALLFASVSPAAAQIDVDETPDDGSLLVDDDTAEAAESDAAEGRISDTENENRIDRAVLGLLIIAFSLAVLTLLFWWHTQPQRRARALARRDEAATVVDEPMPAVDEPPSTGDDGPDLPQRPVPQGAEQG